MSSRSRTLRPAARYKVFKKTNGCCCYCNSKLHISSFTIEHIFDTFTLRKLFLVKKRKVKRSRNIEGCLPCCVKCNNLRSNTRRYQTPMAFALVRGSDFLNKIIHIWSIKPETIYPKMFKLTSRCK